MYFRLCGAQVSVTFTQLCYYTEKAALHKTKKNGSVVFQLNPLYKKRQQARYGLQGSLSTPALEQDHIGG